MDKNLKDKLLFSRADAPEAMDRAGTEAAGAYCRGYIDFLNAAKTEREAVAEAIALAEKQGFVPWEKAGTPKPGGKVYFNQKGKALILCVMGKKPLEEGISILGAHIDSPRLDLKMRPLYEKAGAAYFDTHYYGGIKAYQWTGMPLALHGYAVRKDGRGVTICIGEAAEDPVFFIADLLPHLAGRQMERKGREVVRTEDLDVLAGLWAAPDEAGEGAVKLNMLRILYEKYGITEGDLISAELSVVPALKARDLGLDRSMVGAYGQDDKVCAYPALTALFSLADPAYTALTVLADKEETGSLGQTGMTSDYFKGFLEELASGQKLHRILPRSLCVSADVNTAWYPLYAEALDEYGEARMNRGVILYRYWGAGGKVNTNDAQAETVAALRKILDGAGILWQTGEGGRVDGGSSGTLSRFFAAMDIPTIDLGVPLLSMHSPYEAASKADIYMMHRALAAFFVRS